MELDNRGLFQSAFTYRTVPYGGNSNKQLGKRNCSTAQLSVQSFAWCFLLFPDIEDELRSHAKANLFTLKNGIGGSKDTLPGLQSWSATRPMVHCIHLDPRIQNTFGQKQQPLAISTGRQLHISHALGLKLS